MGDDDEGRRAAQFLHRGDDIGLVLGVQCAGGLIEQDDRGSFEQGAGDGDALALPTGQGPPALTHARVPAMGKAVDDLRDAGEPRGPAHLGVVGRGIADADVGGQSVVEEVDVLEDHGELLHELGGRHVAHVGAADSHGPRAHVPEAGDEAGDGRLAAA